MGDGRVLRRGRLLLTESSRIGTKTLRAVYSVAVGSADIPKRMPAPASHPRVQLLVAKFPWLGFHVPLRCLNARGDVNSSGFSQLETSEI